MQTHRTLVVADRASDSTTLIDVLREQARERCIEATVVVPATLHGLEWAGDPRATIPAAERHAEMLRVALLNAGVARCSAGAGDPDPHAAVDDALRLEEFDEVLINVRTPRLTRAFGVGLADRIAPDTGAQVTSVRARRAVGAT
jgi:hypothetical protein